MLSIITQTRYCAKQTSKGGQNTGFLVVVFLLFTVLQLQPWLSDGVDCFSQTFPFSFVCSGSILCHVFLSQLCTMWTALKDMLCSFLILATCALRLRWESYFVVHECVKLAVACSQSEACHFFLVCQRGSTRSCSTQVFLGF